MADNPDYPQLYQFFGGYFHQDWLMLYRGPEAAIDDYIQASLRSERAQALSELDALMRRIQGEGELRRVLLDDLGCYYDPILHGSSCRQWLAALRDRLSGSLWGVNLRGHRKHLAVIDGVSNEAGNT